LHRPITSRAAHGEGFLRFFGERCANPGSFLFDEPESALSPNRQFEFLKLFHRLNREAITHVVLAPHADSHVASGCAPASNR